jgi:Ca2+-binding EF-hand superfamily protein
LDTPLEQARSIGEAMSATDKTREDFNAIDTDKDGYITADELKESFKDNPKVSPENVAAIIKMADEDENQKISYEEYVELVR